MWVVNVVFGLLNVDGRVGEVILWGVEKGVEKGSDGKCSWWCSSICGGRRWGWRIISFWCSLNCLRYCWYVDIDDVL